MVLRFILLHDAASAVRWVRVSGEPAVYRRGALPHLEGRLGAPWRLLLHGGAAVPQASYCGGGSSPFAALCQGLKLPLSMLPTVEHHEHDSVRFNTAVIELIRAVHMICQGVIDADICLCEIFFKVLPTGVDIDENGDGLHAAVHPIELEKNGFVIPITVSSCVVPAGPHAFDGLIAEVWGR
jgi:hypothetical protein